ncbi:hypothetical protein NET02_16195, partial [Thermomicrobiaceae bacterium CFH 74404]
AAQELVELAGQLEAAVSQFRLRRSSDREPIRAERGPNGRADAAWAPPALAGSRASSNGFSR